MRGARRTRPQVHLVTRARTSRYDDIAARQKRYLVSMGIRTAAVGVAFFAPLPVWGRVLAVVIGLVLPMISVTSANMGPLPETSMRAYDEGRQLPAAVDESTPQQRPRVVDAER